MLLYLLSMLFYALLFLIAAVVLYATAGRDVPDKELKTVFRVSLAVFVVSALACLAFSELGVSYLRHYQDAHRGCPPRNPYTPGIVASGAAGVITAVYAGVQFVKRKAPGRSSTALLLAGTLFVFFVLSMLFASSFCLTF